MKQVLQIGQKQSLNLTPELRQSLKFLAMNNIELAQSLKKICEENPFIEVDVDPQELRIEDLAWEQTETIWDTADNGYLRSRDQLTSKVPVDAHAGRENFRALTAGSFRAELKDQLISNNIRATDRRLVTFLIDSIDEKGFLTDTFSDLRLTFPKNSNWSENDFERCKKYLQSLEPNGVGSRDLSDFLTFQILQSKHPTHIQDIAIRISCCHLKQLSTKNHQKIAVSLGCNASDIEEAIKLITTLKSHPIMDKSSNHHLEIIPDLMLIRDNDKVAIHINSESIPNVLLSTDYDTLASQNRDVINEQVRKYLSDAKQITRSVEQRKLTLIRVAAVIFDIQQNFLQEGSKGLRPLTLQEVADRLDIHESTVSRATNGKYIATPRGIYELKYFFSAKLGADENASSRYIKELIAKIIRDENAHKPLSDQKIQILLKEKEIEVARRTIAKYREQLGILPSRMRLKF
jgi:RNA polymerase sigma-54 factor